VPFLSKDRFSKPHHSFGKSLTAPIPSTPWHCGMAYALGYMKAALQALESME
jgi:hypothetical protein